MPLRQLKSGKAKIKSLPKEYRKQLLNLGLVPGTEITMLINERRRPFLIQSMGVTIAIDRHIGRDIILEKI